ncbi:DM13 domain-containing protein [Thalassotalea fonticola]|uniref:DM13 domain-containing protein n=1 Tax=Thalassotalea fonticola TaxID=3065649 RepID=A0ABZ0GJT1_9GAMM|nr:DM13 domain-containing protein [Colwelliaceae bacterium S1-1]
MLKTAFAFCVSTLLLACGGSGGSASDDVNQVVEPQEFSGQFIDYTVEGLRFKTTTREGLTNVNGEFVYLESETITFAIGDVNLPKIKAKSIITPLDVFASDDVYQVPVSNLLRLLQSLDNDGNADNGITITDNIHELFSNITLDFAANDFEQQANNLLMQTTGIYQSLISEYDAIYHFNESLVKIGEGKLTTCDSDHPMVGYSGAFATFAHDVSGNATIIDNCTIEISNFTYDGGGPEVYIYAAKNHQYSGNGAFIISKKITGIVFNDETLILKLPNGKSLDDLTGISVWCVDFAVDFGNLEFMP